MDAYDTLRKVAREKRDAAIHKARTEYHDTLKAIRALKAGITGQPQQDYRKHNVPKRRGATGQMPSPGYCSRA